MDRVDQNRPTVCRFDSINKMSPSSTYSPEFADPTPKDFEEVKTTHAPLMSVAYFVNEHCRDYNDDYMLCKRANGDPAKCALEGRKVTRCAQDLYAPYTFIMRRFGKMEEKCAQVWDQHWQCLENNNNYYWKCRTAERDLNQCVFKHMASICSWLGNMMACRG